MTLSLLPAAAVFSALADVSNTISIRDKKMGIYSIEEIERNLFDSIRSSTSCGFKQGIHEYYNTVQGEFSSWDAFIDFLETLIQKQYIEPGDPHGHTIIFGANAKEWREKVENPSFVSNKTGRFFINEADAKEIVQILSNFVEMAAVKNEQVEDIKAILECGQKATEKLQALTKLGK